MSENMLSGDQRPIVQVGENDLLAAMQILACIARPHNQRKLEAGGKLLQSWFWARKRHRGEPTPNLDFLHSKSFQRSRIEPKLKTFSADLLTTFRAGFWLQAKILASASKQHRFFKGFSEVSLRSLSAKNWNARPDIAAKFESGELVETKPSEDEAGNIRKTIWRNRRPVLHMALAAGNAIAEVAQDRNEPSERLLKLEVEWQASVAECKRALAEGDENSPAIAEWNRLSKAISEERKNSRRPVELEAIVFDPAWVSPALAQAEEWAATIESQNIVKVEPLWRFVR